MPSAADTAYLTTSEVAALLRVKERKVYDLAATDAIPHRRVTGKLLFPAREIHEWINGDSSAPKDRPPIIAGSHDPLLDWAAREAGTGLATLFDGSAAGLERFLARDAVLSGLHIPETGDWNIATLQKRGVRDSVLIGFARRQQGLILRARLSGAIHGMEDLGGMRVMLRQPGAGSRSLFDQLAGPVDMRGVQFTDTPARTETDAAQAVARGIADVSFGLEAAARLFGLDFVPLAQEQFDLLIDRRAYFQPPVQALMAFLSTEQVSAKAADLGGYDLSATGEVRWVSP